MFLKHQVQSSKMTELINIPNSKSALRDQRLCQFIEKELAILLGEAKNAKQRYRIRRNKKKCTEIIVQSVHESLMVATAKDLFDESATKYEHKNIAEQVHLRRDLITMKYNSLSDINEFLFDFDKKICGLKSIGARMDDVDIIVHLLISLPSEIYEHLILKIDEIDQNNLRFDVVKSLLLDEYKRKKSSKIALPTIVETVSNELNTKCTISGATHITPRKKNKKSRSKRNTKNPEELIASKSLKSATPKESKGIVSPLPKENKANLIRSSRNNKSLHEMIPALPKTGPIVHKTHHRTTTARTSQLTTSTTNPVKTNWNAICYVCDEEFKSKLTFFYEFDLCKKCTSIVEHMMETVSFKRDQYDN